MGFGDKARASVGSHLITAGEHVEDLAEEFAKAYDRRANESHTLERIVRVAGIAVQQSGYALVPELLHTNDNSGEDR